MCNNYIIIVRHYSVAGVSCVGLRVHHEDDWHYDKEQRTPEVPTPHFPTLNTVTKSWSLLWRYSGSWTRPCLLFCGKVTNGQILPKSFIYQQMHIISVLEHIQIYVKTYIKSAPTCFGLRPSSGSLHMSLAKVTFIKSVEVRRFGLLGCVAVHVAYPGLYTVCFISYSVS